jgi:hypothetical protein
VLSTSWKFCRTRPSFTILDYVEVHARPDREAIEAVR